MSESNFLSAAITELQTSLVLTAFWSLVSFVPFWGPRLIFPRHAFGPGKQGLPAYSLTDGMVLVVYLAVANAAVSLLKRADWPADHLAMVFVGCNLLVSSLWLRGLRVLQHCRIASNRSRLLFHLLLHPLAMMSPAGVIANAFVLLGGFGTLFLPGHSPGRRPGMGLLVGFCCLVAWMLLCWGTRRVLEAIADRGPREAAAAIPKAKARS